MLRHKVQHLDCTGCRHEHLDRMKARRKISTPLQKRHAINLNRVRQSQSNVTEQFNGEEPYATIMFIVVTKICNCYDTAFKRSQDLRQAMFGT